MSAPQVWNWHGDMHMELLLQERTAWIDRCFLQAFVSPPAAPLRFGSRSFCCGTRWLFCCPIRFQHWWDWRGKWNLSWYLTYWLFSLCVCVAAGGLSGPRGGADGRGDPDLGAAPAGRKRAIPGRHTEGAGKEWEQGEAQPHTGELFRNNINHFTHAVRLQSLFEN